VESYRLVFQELQGMRPRRLMVSAVATLLVVAAGCAEMRKEDAMPSKRSPTKFVLSPAAEYQPLLTGRPQTTGMRAGRVVLTDCGCNERHSTSNHEEALVSWRAAGRL
jgi:hypothetical protein